MRTCRKPFSFKEKSPPCGSTLRAARKRRLYFSLALHSNPPILHSVPACFFTGNPERMTHLIRRTYMKTFTYNGREHRVFEISAFGRTYEIILSALEYRTPKTLAVMALEIRDDGETAPFGILTSNMAPAVDACLQDDTHAFLKTWSENSDWAEKLVRENSLAEPTGDMAYSGFVCAPLYRWNIERFLI